MKYNQNGLLDNVEPGSRIRKMLSGDMPDMGQGARSELDLPDEPGPAVTGRTPLLGSVRRSRDMPVIRDRLGQSQGE